MTHSGTERTSRPRLWRSLALLIVVAMFASACSNNSNVAGPDDPAEPSRTTDGADIDDDGTSTSGSTAQLSEIGSVATPVGIRLSDGVAAEEAPGEPVEVVEGDALTNEEVAAIVGRVEGIDPDGTEDPAESVDVNRPAETLPPPIVGNTIDTPFPPNPTSPLVPDAPADGPLEVLRFQPQDTIDVAPFLAVTFNEPMIALSTLDQLDDADIPVEISPSREELADRGFITRWRWLGTRTLRLEVVPSGDVQSAGNSSVDRLPGSTEFTITIPAGTESANGATLEDEERFTFTTSSPRPLYINGSNLESLDLNPVFVAVFDQRIDPEIAIDAVTFSSGDVDTVRLATEAEIAGADWVQSTVSSNLPGRTLVFTPTETLDTDTIVSIQVGPGVGSLEGPLVGTESTSVRGQTYGPLSITDRGCARDCQPLERFWLSFNNRLDLERFDTSWVSVSPEIPGMVIRPSGNGLMIAGATKGDTEYEVTLSTEITDVFGQNLSEEQTVVYAVGDARPAFSGPYSDFIVIDPFADPASLTYQTINHDGLRVKAWAVDASDFNAFNQFQNSMYDDTVPEPDWPVVLDTRIDVDGDENTLTQTEVSFAEAFAETDGAIVVRVGPDADYDQNDDDWWQNRPAIAWVQDTNLAVDVFASDTELLIWTTELTTGNPVAGAEISLLGNRDDTFSTDGDGLLRIPLTNDRITGIAATAAGESIVLPRSNWVERSPARQGVWYVIDDRGIYRPGETARITGMVRLNNDDYQLVGAPEQTVSYRVLGARNVEIATGEVELNAFSGFNLAFDLPAGANAGTGRIVFELGNQNYNHFFQVQDFRTPEFEAVVRTETPAPYYLGESTTLAVDASYFAGGPLADSEVFWTAVSQDGTYQPPNWNEFSFGEWTPWWYRSFDFEGFDDFGNFGEQNIVEFSGRTNAAGTHLLQVDLVQQVDGAGGEIADQPISVRAEATVFDVNRQSISASTNILVHPAEFYVGVRSDTSFVDPGEPIEVDTVVVDVDGNPVAGRQVEVTAGRSAWVFADGEYSQQLVDEQTCSITSTDAQTNAQNSIDLDSAMECIFTPDAPGEYEISAVVTDDQGRQNRATLTQWVTGGTGTPNSGVEQGIVTIVPDAEDYAPGDTAELLVQAPFAPATGLMTITRAGIETVTAFDAPNGSTVLDVPVDASDIPNLNVRIDMVGASDRLNPDGSVISGAPQQPAFAAAEIRLDISTAERTLDVQVTEASETLAPGAATSVEVVVTDSSGAPVDNAAVSLIVVDEAVLSLTGYELLDPVATFYNPVTTSFSARLLRPSVLLSNPELFVADAVIATSGEDIEEVVAEALMDDEAMEDDSGEAERFSDIDSGADFVTARSEDGSDEANPDIALRQDFSALAVFAPEEVTNADGAVTVNFDLPDSLTRYRVMAVAAAGDDQFGSGESQITAQLPISVRPSAPRFLNFGDVFELPVVVQNLSDESREIDLVIEAQNLELTGETGRRVTVPANSRVEVRFPAAAQLAGTANAQIIAVSGDTVDAAAVSMPVYTPATSEAFATYGVLDGSEVVGQPIAAPQGVLESVGGLDISTSSTAVSALTDAVLYLHDYDYGTADGYASRIMAVAALRDVLDAFDAPGLPAADVLDARVQSDIAELIALQNAEGTWSWWRRGGEVSPWVTIQSTHALVVAEQNGYAVDQDALARALEASTWIESFFTDESPNTRAAVQSYAIYVRNLSGDDRFGNPAVDALELYRTAELELDSVAQLWTVLTDEAARNEIERRIQNSAIETPSAATFATSYGEDAYLIAHSDRRTDGVVLDALLREDPESDLIVKVVNGLFANQTQGRWRNAQENAFILLAVNEYFDTFEGVTPDFVAQVWIGDTYAAEATFAGRSTDTFTSRVPMEEVIAAGDTQLIVSNTGTGRLYYRLGLDYAPENLDLDPRDEGFVVQRTYEAIDDPADVVQRADGTWEIAAGANVRVRVEMVADARRNQVALVDPLPAGLEPVNPALATSQTVFDDDEQSSGWSWWRWFEHQNLRDDRAEAFATRLRAGTFEYTYVAQATTPGTFVVPPATAEEIFNPEVFGRSASDTVVVVPQ